MQPLQRLRGACLVAAILLPAVGARAEWVAIGDCHLPDGRPVQWRSTVSIPDIALATYDRVSGAPVIYYNPRVIDWLPPQLRTWIFAHECAHLVLDHLRFGVATAEQEIEADCWATRQLTARGALTPDDIELMESAIATLLPDHWKHMPGRFRAIELQRCAQYPRFAITPRAQP